MNVISTLVPTVSKVTSYPCEKLPCCASAETTTHFFSSATEIVTTADVVFAPRLSVAIAVILCDPILASIQIKLKEDEESSPNFVVPLKNSTKVTVPSKSVAVAEIVISSPSLKDVLLLGDVIDIVGFIFPPFETNINTSSLAEYVPSFTVNLHL